MTPELKPFFDKANEDKEFAKKLMDAESPGAVQALAAEHGITLTLKQVLEAKDIFERNNSGALPDESLEKVAGGVAQPVEIVVGPPGGGNNRPPYRGW